MHRRHFLQAVAFGAAALALRQNAIAALEETKIKRIRFFRAPNSREMFNQSSHIVLVETESGLVGVGEGGSTDMITQLAGLLVGESPNRIEHLWQKMYRGYFYPPGREKIHAQGALDMALWDLKGKALGVPVYELLGGLTRKYCECYATSFPRRGTLVETARACMEAGFRAYRFHGAEPRERGGPYNSRQAVRDTLEMCKQVREGVGKDGDWAIDFHTRLDMPDALRLCTLIEDLEPYFVEDLVRSENPGVYRQLRPKVKVPIAVGEHFGDRWEVNELIEDRLIDYSRVSLPNAGGITEFVKISALCETHYVGLTPHFTGPIATAALVHCCSVFSGPVLMEMLGQPANRPAHLPESYDFREGKLWPKAAPGLGVVVDVSNLEKLAEITEARQPTQLYRRPDGSITNW